MSPNLLEAEEKLHKSDTETKIVKNERWNIVLLVILYTIQSIPKGLSDSIPLILQTRGITYQEQAIFNLVNVPFVLKLLWAPFVDSLYSTKFGRRKTWLVPSQLLMGFLFLFMYFNAETWLGNESGTKKPKILLLTVIFLLSNTLRATHDIALDGWALTMFNRKNVGNAGTCNSVGYLFGYTVGYTAFTALNSQEFCNKWLRRTPEPTGCVSISEFTLFWSVIIIVSAIWVWIFKKDDSLEMAKDDDEVMLSVKGSFTVVKDILKIKPIKPLCIVIIFRSMCTPFHTVTALKLIDAGVTRDNLVLLSMPVLMLHAIIPFIFKRYLTGPRSIDYFPRIIGFWLMWALVNALFVYLTPRMKKEDTFPLYYYGVLFLVDGIDSTLSFATTVLLLAFFARISDPVFGGTYTTFLNTVSNFGREGCLNIALWLIDLFTWTNCSIGDIKSNKMAVTPVRECSVFVDGYYVEIIFVFILGSVWLNCCGREKILRLSDVPESSWRVVRKSRKIPENGHLPFVTK